MKVSTVIPVFNGEKYLETAVQSLLATRYPHLEIVIVDDGSTDGSLRLARELEQRFPNSVRVATHPGGQNRGVSATRNRGLETSTGDLISFLDADDYVHEWRFDSAIDILNTRPEVDGVYQTTAMRFMDDQERQAWWDERSLFGIDTDLDRNELLNSLLNAIPFHTNSIVFRRSLLERTGGFHPQLRIAEDCHLWLRMAYVGHLVAGDLTQPVSTYFRHADSAYRASTRQRLHVVRALCDFYQWTARIDRSDPRRKHVANSIADYILRGVEGARMSSDRAFAWELSLKGAALFPRLCRERRWYGNLARIVLDRK